MAQQVGFTLSLEQQALWPLCSDGTGPRSQMITTVDPAQVEAQLHRVLERHEVLRTVFRTVAGLRLPQQVVLEPVAPGLVIRDADLDAVRARDLAAPFDLVAGPLLRASLVGDVLVLTACALVADGASLTTVVEELGGSQLDEPLQHADYAGWQQEEGTATAGPLTVPSAGLPLARARRRPGSPARVAVDRGPLVGLAATLGVTEDAAALATWVAVLARRTGRPHVQVAVTDDRREGELVGAVGPYAAVSSVEVTVEPADTLRTLALRIGVRGPAPSGGHAFGFVGGPRDAYGSPGLPEVALGVGGVWFDTAALDSAEAERIAASVSILAGGCPDSPIHELALLGEAELAAATSIDGPPLDLPVGVVGVEDLVAEQAKAHPDRVAVVAVDGTLTYGELMHRADRLAAGLAAAGMGRGAVVALVLNRTSDLLIAVLGVLRAGATYLPLNPEHPKDRLSQCLTDAGAGLVLHAPDLAAALPAAGVPRCTVTALEREPGASVAAEPPDPAYIIYTSGSTGQPKGVLVTRANLLAYTVAVTERLGLAEGSPATFGVVTTLSTDLGNTCVFPALTTGGTLVLVDVDAAVDGDLFAATVQRTPLDVLKITPSHLGVLLAGRDDLAAVLPRRLLVLGGEATPRSLVERLQGSGTRIANHYGPTETTVGSVAGLLFEAGERDVVPLGRALAGTSLRVVDQAGKPVALGAPGELLIGGAGLSAGYVDDAARTAEKFVADPLGRISGVYRTGDQVRVLPGGLLEFVARIDDQVKIRGFRVEPEEVASVLRTHPRVGAATVLPREDRPGDLRLVAYVVATGAPPSAELLREFLAERLPDVMVPSVFALISALPLTANGKVDTGALPLPEELTVASAPVVAPQTGTEHRMQRIWAEVLGVPTVSTSTDFFALGGHSLLATQVIARVRNAFEVQLPLHTLFTAPTIASLSATVDELLAAAFAEQVDFAALLDDLESMSDDEVSRLLAGDS